MQTDQQRHDSIAAEQRAAHWMAQMNAARESGNDKKAAACEAKAQHWLDRMNKLLGNS